jgi:hypothetical protein
MMQSRNWARLYFKYNESEVTEEPKDYAVNPFDIFLDEVNDGRN